ncbi:hypothetical protein SADUNF_Sadunf08G0023100 [Salix dunnii]|uniref:Uncharacterized protein n=1 Tax=Salix dunnii TaxID=1413687 RepID=A0A835JUA1_9ROSI|nr:hypothetical protein SADUNF_Sadunf08G0023100 [Salix dunnii]
MTRRGHSEIFFETVELVLEIFSIRVRVGTRVIFHVIRFLGLGPYVDDGHWLDCKRYALNEDVTCVTCGKQHQRVVELDLKPYKLLENNCFSQNIPRELGSLFRLEALVLANNSFSGEIPANISRCSNLLGLESDGNNLTGKLPADFGSLSKLKAMRIDYWNSWKLHYVEKFAFGGDLLPRVYSEVSEFFQSTSIFQSLLQQLDRSNSKDFVRLQVDAVLGFVV